MSRAGSVVALAFVGIGLLFATSQAREARRYIAPRTASDTDRPPFSGAVQVGKTLYLSADG